MIAGEETIEMLRLRKENAFLRAIAENKPIDEVKKTNAELKIELSKSKDEIKGLIKSRNDLQIKLKVQDYETEGTKFLITKLQMELSEWKSGQRVANTFQRERPKPDMALCSNLSQVSVPNSVAYSRTTLRYAPSEASQSSLASEEMSQFSRGGPARRTSNIYTPPSHLNSRLWRNGGSRASFRSRPINVKGPVFVNHSPPKKTSVARKRSMQTDWSGNFVRNRNGSRNESDVERSSIKSQDSYINNKDFSGASSSKLKNIDGETPRMHPISPNQRSALSISSIRSGLDSQASASSLGSRVLRPSMRDFFASGTLSVVSSTADLSDLQPLPEKTRLDHRSSPDKKDGGSWISPRTRKKMGWSSPRNLGARRLSSRPAKGTDRKGDSDRSKKSRTHKAQRWQKKKKVKPKDKHKPTQTTLLGLLSSSRNASSDSSSVKKHVEGSEGGRHIVL